MSKTARPPRYLLLVPIGDMRFAIKEQTACVAEEIEPGRYLVHYEEPGNAQNIVTFEDRIRHAAGRLHDNYPTSKMIGGDDESFIKVGTVFLSKSIGWHIEEIINRKELEQWSDGPHYEGGSPDLYNEARIKTFNENIRGSK